MTLLEYVGGWIYWPAVSVVVFGAIATNANFISMVYTELWKQVEELKRIKSDSN